MEREELAAWLRLTLTPKIGNDAARKLLAAFGLPHALFDQSPTALAQVVNQAQAAQLRIEPPTLAAQLETTWRWLNGEDSVQGDGSSANPEARGESAGQRRIVVLGDADYPSSLLNMADPPIMLYLLGAASACDGISTVPSTCIAIVGTRNPTPQGLGNARQFARALCESGLTVVSGMALGIDGAAHEGALEGLGKGSTPSLATVAVVGTGLDRVYPKSHRNLAHAIAQHGLIISEYPLGTPPLVPNFPKRNRIIAGLAQGTLVVEAALKSGSLITARLAAEQGKEVFAIPGSIHSPQSRGCHALIRQGAKLVESAQDILEELKLEFAINLISDNDHHTRAIGINDAENTLLQAFGFDPVSLDALQARTGIDTASLQAQLMVLELDGHVGRLPGGMFQRMASA